jgi:hypothetical protein
MALRRPPAMRHTARQRQRDGSTVTWMEKVDGPPYAG